jgi:tetratricopeptide (TPR) repeat protein
MFVKPNIFINKMGILLLTFVPTICCFLSEGYAGADEQINPFTLQKDAGKREKAELLFTEAEAEYRAGNYWQCSRKLVTLVDFNPDFSQADQAVYLLGNCLYQQKMTDAAAKLYSRMVKKYISSPFLPDALLGLQRISYENNELQESLKYYQALMRGNPSREIINLAAYYAGMAYYKIDDYPRCVAALRTADESSPYYDYQLYTLAISLLRVKDVNSAVTVFHQLFELPVNSDERRHVIDEGHLSLGYLYYELNYFDDALREFDKLTAASDLHPAALLATGWALTMMKEWEQAIVPLTLLYTDYPEHEVTQEGLFLLGRCYLKLERFKEAIHVYDLLIDLFPEEKQVVTSVEKINANIDRERKRVEKRQMELLVLESKLVDDLSRASNDGDGQIEENTNQRQSELLQKISGERVELANRLENLDKLAASTAVKEQRRNWRAYAEYGKTRAAFLQRQKERHEKQVNSVK